LTKFKIIQHQESFLEISATKQHIYQDFMGYMSKRILTGAYIILQGCIMNTTDHCITDLYEA